jgi:23S rRNA (cytosine1962-C5)-methyltransferase
VRFAGAHKSGFFCDQRDNRRQLAAFWRGRCLLDLCCYTGGFAVQARRLGEAAEVTGVDLDEEPLALARENANLNQARVRFVQADAFAYMRDMLRGGRTFDVVVLDPPKLIRSRAELEEGTRRHFDLNRLAMQLVAPGGLLLSCTCSGLLGQDEFLRLLYAAARQAGPRQAGSQPAGEAPEAGLATERSLQVLARTGAAADHPVAANCPETEYLKAVWMRLA